MVLNFFCAPFLVFIVETSIYSVLEIKIKKGAIPPLLADSENFSFQNQRRCKWQFVVIPFRFLSIEQQRFKFVHLEEVT